MPVQETQAKLWFKTEEEKKIYDDLMISNIELKEGDDPDSPYFSYLASRSKKEKFPAYSENFFKAFEQVSSIDNSDKYKNFSYRFWHEWTLEKYFIGMGVTYLVLRELPIRNFYARSFIMTLLGVKVISNYRFRGINNAVETNMVINEDPNLF